jgi:TetR/AcrR family transcriptional repressor of mexJK operon
MKANTRAQACPSPLDDARYGRILQRATQAFLSQGYAGTSVETVAIDAGVSKLTIYGLFGDKLGLATAVLQDLERSLEAAVRSAIDMEASAEDCLVNLGSTYVRWMTKDIGRGTHHYAISRLLLEMSSTHREFSASWVDSNKRLIQVPLADYIGNSIRQGYALEEDSLFIASQFFGAIFNPAQIIVTENGSPRSFNEADIDDLVRRKVRLFLRGCIGA